MAPGGVLSVLVFWCSGFTRTPGVLVFWCSGSDSPVFWVFWHSGRHSAPQAERKFRAMEARLLNSSWDFTTNAPSMLENEP